MVGNSEIAASVILPHFDAVRDVFLEHGGLPKLRRVRLEVTGSAHDTDRHFAACRDDGLLIQVAPQAADLPIETLVAILSHEFGHAADFAYPAHWYVTAGQSGVASWIGDLDGKRASRWRKQWARRCVDQVEWAADAIAEAVTGERIGYCGPCLLQCFSGGKPRPKGLR